MALEGIGATEPSRFDVGVADVEGVEIAFLTRSDTEKLQGYLDDASSEMAAATGNFVTSDMRDLAEQMGTVLTDRGMMDQSSLIVGNDGMQLSSGTQGFSLGRSLRALAEDRGTTSQQVTNAFNAVDDTVGFYENLYGMGAAPKETAPAMVDAPATGGNTGTGGSAVVGGAGDDIAIGSEGTDTLEGGDDATIGSDPWPSVVDEGAAPDVGGPASGDAVRTGPVAAQVYADAALNADTREDKVENLLKALQAAAGGAVGAPAPTGPETLLGATLPVVDGPVADGPAPSPSPTPRVAPDEMPPGEPAPEAGKVGGEEHMFRNEEMADLFTGMSQDGRAMAMNWNDGFLGLDSGSPGDNERTIDGLEYIELDGAKLGLDATEDGNVGSLYMQANDLNVGEQLEYEVRNKDGSTVGTGTVDGRGVEGHGGDTPIEISLNEMTNGEGVDPDDLVIRFRPVGDSDFRVTPWMTAGTNEGTAALDAPGTGPIAGPDEPGTGPIAGPTPGPIERAPAPEQPPAIGDEPFLDYGLMEQILALLSDSSVLEADPMRPMGGGRQAFEPNPDHQKGLEALDRLFDAVAKALVDDGAMSGDETGAIQNAMNEVAPLLTEETMDAIAKIIEEFAGDQIG